MTAASLAAVAAALAARDDRRLPAALRLVRLAGGRRPDRHPEVPDGAGPEYLGRLHETGLGPAERRRRGAHYTPLPLARRLVAEARRGRSGGPVQVCDPATGGGAFLLAAADTLVGEGLEPSRVLGGLHGADLDPLAVAVTEAALWLWGARHGLVGRALRVSSFASRVVVTDGRLATPATWARREGFDLVVGNPPFRSQRRRATVRTAREREALAERFGSTAGVLADDAALFLLAATDLLVPGGRAVLILPEALLGTSDSAAARAAVAEVAELRVLWQAGVPVFDGPVRVCAPVVERHRAARDASGRRVRLCSGPDVRPAGTAPAPDPGGGSWAPLLPGHRIPSTAGWRTAGSLAELATATAGFRDQYYGIVDAVRDNLPPGPRHLPLVTSGILGPAHLAWGERPVRFARRAWRAPTIDLDHLERLDPAVARWAVDRLGPKVLVATQTRVLEAAVDETGWCYPSVPVVSLACAARRRWEVLAVVLAPPVSAWAHERAAGTALSAGALRPRAADLLAVPLPSGTAAWSAGAALARRAQRTGDPRRRRALLLELGETMTAAYGLSGRAGSDLMAWWAERLGPVR